MVVKNEKLQYKLTKFLVPQQEIVASLWQKIRSTFHITTGMLVDSIADAQKGTLPPCVAPSTLLLNALWNSSPSFPPDTTLPFPLGKDYVHALYKLCNVHVYIYTERLGYVISVLLVHKRKFSVLKMIPIPVPMNQNNFFYIDIGESILCMDRTRQYYFTMRESVG